MRSAQQPGTSPQPRSPGWRQGAAPRLDVLVPPPILSWLALGQAERALQHLAELGDRAATPVVEEEDPRLLADHVVVNRDDMDLARAERLQDGLELVLGDREVAIHDGVVVRARERSPRVHAHRLA